MEKQQAIEELKRFKEESGFSRDQVREVYNQFKYHPELDKASITCKDVVIQVTRAPFWEEINTCDINDISRHKRAIDSVSEDTQIVNSLLRKENLRKTDKLNYERKTFNKQLRDLNKLEELGEEIRDGLKKIQLGNFKATSVIQKTNDILLVQLSDLHIAETTNEFREEKFNITTASKRLQKFAEIVKQEIKQRGIKKVVLAMTGDMCNNDSIYSKQQLNCVNKATAILLATKLIHEFILDVLSMGVNLSIASVSGNESRMMPSEQFFTDEDIITNSCDYMIFNLLEELYKNNSKTTFLQGRNNEQIININGQNILLTHGVQMGKGDVGKAVQQTVARYSDKGINIRYCVFGHLHATKLSDYFMRSSSLVGNNSYATNVLNLNSRASQNIALISDNGDIRPMGIDLQNIDGYEGYDISYELGKFGIKEMPSTNYEDMVLYV